VKLHLVAAAALAVVVLVLPATAGAKDLPKKSECKLMSSVGTKREYTCTWGPIPVSGYQVRQDVEVGGIPKPDVDGSITSMAVDVVDDDGTPVPISRLMLHHIVFLAVGKPDATCAGRQFTLLDSKTTIPANLAQRFYGAGEERAQLELPPGYGYKVGGNDQWAMVWMLMNHKHTPDSAYVQYTIGYDTATDLTGVTPYWLDVRNCSADPVYNVPGGGRKGSTHTESATVTMPEAGRIVAGGGHVHGGAKALSVTEPGCADRELYRSTPTWGLASHPFYNVKPILHEPGPINMSGFNSAQGIPVAKGEQLKLSSLYDDRYPHTRVMGISVMYLAPDAGVTATCGGIPGDIRIYKTDQPGRTSPPKFTVPLTGLNSKGRAVTISAPPGKIKKLGGSARLTVGSLFFSQKNLSIPEGAKLTWKVMGSGMELHNVTLASGPRGFGSDNLNGGRTFSYKFTKPGTYRIFCALHPVDMSQRVIVRSKKK
jgi:plastocyanin